MLATVRLGLRSGQAADAGLFAEPLSTVTARNPAGNSTAAAAARDCAHNSAESSKGKRKRRGCSFPLCACVWLRAHFRCSISVASPESFPGDISLFRPQSINWWANVRGHVNRKRRETLPLEGSQCANRFCSGKEQHCFVIGRKGHREASWTFSHLKARSVALLQFTMMFD